MKQMKYVVICLTEPEVDVREGDDAILPCSFNPVQDLTGKLFDWKKDEEKEVFLFDSLPVYNEGRSGQDKQFSGRVTHFSDELKYSNASIKIHNATVADSGNYTCVIFPRDNKQTYIIRLLVGEWFYVRRLCGRNVRHICVVSSKVFDMQTTLSCLNVISPASASYKWTFRGSQWGRPSTLMRSSF